MRVGRSAIGLCGTGSQIARPVRSLPERLARLGGGARRGRLRCGSVLDLRLYRVTLLPFAVGLIVVAFSLHTGPAALPGSLPGAAFDAQAAQAAITRIAPLGSDPPPGSAADDTLAQTIATSPPPSRLAHPNFQS